MELEQDANTMELTIYIRMEISLHQQAELNGRQGTLHS
ncbi:BgTH12-01095 [Blumeria graminis f. sp. triticale]|uniref:BgTH12-01092 n=1 Tax=Blumeria graminis f. sp. triticale TaxID=1689686 RepID=A0A9W4DD25_BLUGR|nr:BgTH12-01092 [Blumeria graminis f. sp. triticale]CAD6505605.1 BgTH12-01095 [Blumeria graminis f. sp. triticale]